MTLFNKLPTIMAVLALAFLTGQVSAAAPFCDEQETFDCVCRQVTKEDLLGNPTEWNVLDDVIPGSDWFNQYCTNSLEGTLKQKRTVFEIIKPSCTERVETVETQEVQEDFCKTCPDPITLGTWQPVQCAGNKTVVQRTVLAYFFTPEVQDCELGRFIEIKAEEGGACSTPGGALFLWLAGNALIIAGLIVAVAIAAIIFIKRKK